MFLGEYCAEFLYRFVWRKPDIEIVERNPLVELKYKILGGSKEYGGVFYSTVSKMYNSWRMKEK